MTKEEANIWTENIGVSRQERSPYVHEVRIGLKSGIFFHILLKSDSYKALKGNFLPSKSSTVVIRNHWASTLVLKCYQFAKNDKNETILEENRIVIRTNQLSSFFDYGSSMIYRHPESFQMIIGLLGANEMNFYLHQSTFRNIIEKFIPLDNSDLTALPKHDAQRDIISTDPKKQMVRDQWGEVINFLGYQYIDGEWRKVRACIKNSDITYIITENNL